MTWSRWSVALSSQEPEEDSPETLAGHGAAVRFSSLGLLAPLHALLLTLQLVVKPD